MTFDLSSLGWDDDLATAYARYDKPSRCPARVSRVDRGVCTVLSPSGAMRASLAGSMLAAAACDPVYLPCAGDWVVAHTWPDRRITVEAVLPRRTATYRALVPLPDGGSVLDTPGVRAVGLVDAAVGLDLAFADVGLVAQECRFGDCAHVSEPGCAVLAAVAAGTLSPRRLENWQ